jgi:hypothetical protein
MGDTRRLKKLQAQRLREMAAREREIDRIIQTRFNSSLMSNAKWHRAFRALEPVAASIRRCRWKFVDDERTWDSPLPHGDTLAVGYWDSASVFVIFKHVEWFELVTAEPEAVLAALRGEGTFAAETVADGVRVYGYR